MAAECQSAHSGVCPQQNTQQAEAWVLIKGEGKVKKKCIMSFTACVCLCLCSDSTSPKLPFHFCCIFSQTRQIKTQQFSLFDLLL